MVVGAVCVGVVAVAVVVVVVGIVDVVVVDVVAVAAVEVTPGPIVDCIAVFSLSTSDVLELGIKGTPPREVVIEISISRLRVWMAVFPVRSGDGEEVREREKVVSLGNLRWNDNDR